jgi:hypothetical protein
VTLAGDEAQGEPGPAVTGEGARRLEPDRWAPAIDRLLSGVPWVWERGAMRLAATSVRVRADDADVGSLFDRLLGGLVDEEAALLAQHTLSVVSRRGRNAAGDIGGAPRYRVVLDGRVVARVDSPESAVVHALHHLDELAVSGSSDALVFHAGAVERDDRVVVVLGVSGRGKSTLTAALVSRGFRYLSDEVVAVDIATSGVWPYPKALDLHPGSLDLLGLDAGAASLQLPWSKVKVLPDRLGEVSHGGKAALLVFLAETLAPVATPGAAPVEVVPPAEALVAILPVTFEHTMDDPDHFAALAAFCEATPSIRVGRAPLDATIAAIEAAVAVAVAAG